MHVVTVIIPAFNEAARIANVIQTVRQASLVQDILVIDDGSRDNTAAVAESCGVRVHRLPKNQGKGTAMRTGAIHALGDIILFLDADLLRLTPVQVDALIRPVLEHKADMSVGIFRGGRATTDFAQTVTPSLSGQRCLYQDFFLSAPLIEGSRSGVEIALTAHARACKLTLHLVTLDGVTHTMKEEKIGVVRGVFSRLRMYAEIFLTMLRYQLITRLPRRESVGSK